MLGRPNNRLGQLSAEAKNDTAMEISQVLCAFTWHVCLTRWCAGLDSTPPLCIILFSCLSHVQLPHPFLQAYLCRVHSICNVCTGSIEMSNLEKILKVTTHTAPPNSYCAVQTTLIAPLTLLRPTHIASLTLSALLTLLHPTHTVRSNSHCLTHTERFAHTASLTLLRSHNHRQPRVLIVVSRSRDRFTLLHSCALLCSHELQCPFARLWTVPLVDLQ